MYQLGVLGGMGPESTALFLQRIVANTKADSDAAHIPAIILNNTLVPDRTKALLGKGPSPLPELQKDADLLVSLGVSVIASPCNTAHAFFEKLALPKTITLLNMIQETLLAAGKERPLCVLGTTGLSKARVYESAADADTKFSGLSEEQQERIMSAINFVKAGTHRAAADLLLAVVGEIQKTVNPLFLLACTELSVLHPFVEGKFDFLDALEVLSRKTVTACGYSLR